MRSRKSEVGGRKSDEVWSLKSLLGFRIFKTSDKDISSLIHKSNTKNFFYKQITINLTLANLVDINTSLAYS